MTPDLPFDSLKVVELTTALAGPMIGRYLAHFGATVVRVESAHYVDISRLTPPYQGQKTDPDASAYHALYNSSKLSLALNLNHPQGAGFAKSRLLPWADIVIENFSPGVMKRWGLDYDALRAIKPDIVMLSTSNLGQTGPLSARKGYGPQLVGWAGFTHLTGFPDSVPSQPFGAYTDVIAPKFALAALIAALDYRRRTGVGQYLDVSQLEAAVHFLAPLVLEYAITGQETSRVGNRSPCAAPHGAFRCLGDDRWCAIAAASDKQWICLCRAIEREDLAADPRFVDLEHRKENEEELEQIVEAWTQRRTTEDVVATLQGAGVPAGIVQTGADLNRDPQLRHREYFVERDHPTIGRHLYQAPALILSDAAPTVGRAPLLYEHTETVCREILGISEDEFVQLLTDGVLE